MPWRLNQAGSSAGPGATLERRMPSIEWPLPWVSGIMYTRCRAPGISPGNPFVPDFPQSGEAALRYSHGLWLTRLLERRVVNNFRLGLRGASGLAPSYNSVKKGVALISFRPPEGSKLPHRHRTKTLAG